jgi:hypothetical protein
MLNKAFFKNAILFTVIVGGSLLALYIADQYQTQNPSSDGMALESIFGS